MLKQHLQHLLAAGLLALGFFMFAAHARAAEIAGLVTDTENRPIFAAHFSVKDQTGKVVREAHAHPQGDYSIVGLASGEYSISLTLPGTHYQGQTVETGVPAEGLCIYWVVAQSAQALATARTGVKAGACRPVSAAAAGAE
jgi:hypothetical protein